MKKKLLLLLASLGLALTGCSKSFEESYTPSHGGKVEPEAPKSETNVEDEDINDDATTTYEFYFSYSYSDEPLATVVGPTFKVLGNDKVPEFLKKQDTLEAAGREKGYVVDPAFPTFIGWSFYGACLDDENLWDFSIDKPKNNASIVALYAIWVNK